MDIGEIVAILIAGVGAGAINAVVGSGTLFTFPVLLAFGYPPVVATVSNSIGLVPGALGGVLGYRRELAGQRSRLLRLAPMSLLGALTGATLLLVLPGEVFANVVPVLIIAACLLIVIQPWLNRWLRSRRPSRPDGGPGVLAGVYGAGLYGGYFAAAQGIVLISVLGSGLDEELQRVNALKISLAAVVNATAAVIYIVFADPVWTVVGLIAVGSVIGGYLGGSLGRLLPPVALRVIVVLVGLSAVAQLLLW